MAQVTVPAEHLDEVIGRCIHCGLCLSVCPTYDMTRNEASSPRGRIRLFRSVRDGSLMADRAFADEMNFCLDCQACQTACPAGVRYGEIVEEARALTSSKGLERIADRLIKGLLLNVIWKSRSSFMRFAALLRLVRKLGLVEAVERSGLASLLPRVVARALALLPEVDGPPFDESLPRGAYGSPPAEPGGVSGSAEAGSHSAGASGVGLLAGCVMNGAFQETLTDIVEVLERNGIRTTVPAGVFCCGSLHAHNGDPSGGERLARETLRAFPERLEAIIVPAAGCSAHLRKFAPDRIVDVSEFLRRAGYARPDPHECTVTYHEACHLVHGQGISAGPRELIRNIPGVRTVELPEATWCCGSAGIYNVIRPGEAMSFGDRKAAAIASTGAEIVLTANPGCHLQIRAALRARGANVEVLHPVSLLNRAYRLAYRRA